MVLLEMMMLLLLLLLLLELGGKRSGRASGSRQARRAEQSGAAHIHVEVRVGSHWHVPWHSTSAAARRRQPAALDQRRGKVPSAAASQQQGQLTEKKLPVHITASF